MPTANVQSWGLTQFASSPFPVELDNTDMCVTVRCVTQWHIFQPDSTEIDIPFGRRRQELTWVCVRETEDRVLN